MVKKVLWVLVLSLVLFPVVSVVMADLPLEQVETVKLTVWNNEYTPVVTNCQWGIVGVPARVHLWILAGKLGDWGLSRSEIEKVEIHVDGEMSATTQPGEIDVYHTFKTSGKKEIFVKVLLTTGKVRCGVGNLLVYEQYDLGKLVIDASYEDQDVSLLFSVPDLVGVSGAVWGVIGSRDVYYRQTGGTSEHHGWFDIGGEVVDFFGDTPTPYGGWFWTNIGWPSECHETSSRDFQILVHAPDRLGGQAYLEAEVGIFWMNAQQEDPPLPIQPPQSIQKRTIVSLELHEVIVIDGEPHEVGSPGVAIRLTQYGDIAAEQVTRGPRGEVSWTFWPGWGSGGTHLVEVWIDGRWVSTGITFSSFDLLSSVGHLDLGVVFWR